MTRRRTLPETCGAFLLAAVLLAAPGCGRRLDPQVREGYDLVVAGKVDEAIALANTLLSKDPKNAQARNLMGLALYKTGDAEGAVEQYRRALEMDPKYAEAYFNLGNAYERLAEAGSEAQRVQRLQDAEASYGSAVRHQKKFVLAHYNLGHIYSVTNRPDQAVTELRRCIELDDQFFPAFILLGQIAYGSGDFAGAITHLTRATELVPTAKEIRVLLGNAHMQSGSPEALVSAEQEFRAAAGIDSTYLDAVYSLGMSLAAQGKNDEAAVWLRRARPLASGRPDSAPIVRLADEFFARTGLPKDAPADSAATSASPPAAPAQG